MMRKRARNGYDGDRENRSALNKKAKRHPALTQDSYDLWKNLDRIRKLHKNSDKVLKRSVVLIPLSCETNNTIVQCIQHLLRYVDQERLHFKTVSGQLYTHVVILKNFSVLDFCLVVPVLLSAVKRLNSKTSDYFKFDSHIFCNGTFFVPDNTVISIDRTTLQLKETALRLIPGFKELNCTPTESNNIQDMINSLANFISKVKFGKNKDDIYATFKRELALFSKRTRFGLGEVSMLEKGMLIDSQAVIDKNLPLVQNTKAKLQTYVQTLLDENEDKITTEVQTTAAKSSDAISSTNGNNNVASKPIQSRFQNNQSHNVPSSRYSHQATSTAIRKPYTAKEASPLPTQSRASPGRPRFMTIEEIRGRCIATVRASIDSVKKISAYQIVKVYVKFPKKDSDTLFSNLDELRNKSNCNIVVLHYNNEHESKQWLDGLDLTRYIRGQDEPNASTVRILSIGGVAEYIVTALEGILALLQEQT